VGSKPDAERDFAGARGRRKIGKTSPRMAGAGAVFAVVVMLLSLPALAGAATKAEASAGGKGVFQTTREYFTHFYPRWFSYSQAKPAPDNGLTMPRRITPLYHTVVAINDDTYYAAAFVNVPTEPAVLTVPSTKVRYSLLVLDGFGEVIETKIPRATPGTYVVVKQGWAGVIPPGLTRIEVPYDFTQWIIRADKHSPNGLGPAAAQGFVRRLRLTTLAEWKKNYLAGPTNVVSELYYSIPYKGIADREARFAPNLFLKQLQEAVHSDRTQPLSAAEQQLSERFDTYFGAGGSNAGSAKRAFRNAARAAHGSIVANYRKHTIGRNWVNFTNIAEWKGAYLDRSSIAEYILYGNNFGAAAYYHTFEDGRGRALNGKRGRVYTLTFSRKQIPEAERFWSLTAYLPGSIELVPNKENKYVVASYTSGLKKNADGSITIYMAKRRPPGAPKANWLPVPAGEFNVMLRDYGPEGSVKAGEYVPPAVKLSNR
jgi:hypothetical protein